MHKKIYFLLIYLFTWVGFFELARIYFLISTSSYARQVPRELLYKSLWYGLKMDLSMASYITVVAGLFVWAGVFIPQFRKKTIYVYYTTVLLFLQLLLFLIDAEIFKAWGTRIDFTPLKYLSSPKEVWASVSHLAIWILLPGFFVVFLISSWIFRKIIARSLIFLENNQYRFFQSLLVPVFIIALIIPIRGGLQLSPLNQSSVFFSKNQYANNAAINASWNFLHSLTQRNLLDQNPYWYMKPETANALVQPLLQPSGNSGQRVLRADIKNPNLIIIIWESFTEKALNQSAEGRPVIQYFPQLIREGIYFQNCYSSGDRTDKGISAVLSSYPALPKVSVVNFPPKAARLTGLGNIFLNQGYSTQFYYGGEPEFANIKSYLVGQQFQQLTSKANFNKSEMNSKWGVHDGVMMKRILEDLPSLKQPFFTVWLTLSSHEPFETPVPSVFSGKDKQTRFFNSLHYSDSVVYRFISSLKQMPFWKNTLVLITADHGHYLPVTGNRADDYRIPVLWIGGALEKQNIIVDKTVSQLDMAGSLAEQLHFGKHPFRFSRNVFDTTLAPWAFFTYNEGIGLVTDSSRLLFDHAGKKLVFEEGKTSRRQEELAKALLQIVYDDFLKR